MKSHVDLGTEFLKDEPRVDWHNKAVFNFRKKRDATVRSIPEWEELRQHASLVKEHVIAHLDEYLLEFEKNAIANGVQVHWASSAEEHNQIVHSIIDRHQATHCLLYTSRCV